MPVIQSLISVGLHVQCRPNPLVLLIAVRKAQNIQCRVSKTQTNRGTKYPCNGKSALRFYRCWKLCQVVCEHDVSSSVITSVSKRFSIKNCHWIWIMYCIIYLNCFRFFLHFNRFMFLHAFLCSTDTRNPPNPGFCPHTNLGLRVLKRAGYSGFWVPRLNSLFLSPLVDPWEKGHCSLYTTGFLTPVSRRNPGGCRSVCDCKSRSWWLVGGMQQMFNTEAAAYVRRRSRK